MKRDHDWPPVTQPLQSEALRAADQRREVQALVRQELRRQQAGAETKHLRGPREER